MSSRSAGPPLVPVFLLAAATACAIAAIPVATDRRATAADLVWLNPAGWLIALFGVLVFVWFRTADAAASADRSYVIPRWNPPRLSRLLAVLCWLASIAHAFFIAEALARR